MCVCVLLTNVTPPPPLWPHVVCVRIDAADPPLGLNSNYNPVCIANCVNMAHAYIAGIYIFLNVKTERQYNMNVIKCYTYVILGLG